MFPRSFVRLAATAAAWVIVDDKHHFIRHANQARVDAAIAAFFAHRFVSPATPSSRME